MKPMILLTLVLCTGMGLVSGCSKSEPSPEFLSADMFMRINAADETRLLHMKPADLYGVFDMNVKKKWKRVHENAWDMIIDMVDPNTKVKSQMKFTLEKNPTVDGILVKRINVNGEDYNTGLVVEMLTMLDQGFVSQQR